MRRSVDVLVPTFRRARLAEALASLGEQDVPGGCTMRVIVADNDETPSAQATVEEAAASVGAPVRYVHAPSRNVSVARNALLDASGADWIAFLDDDETAPTGWLGALLARADRTGADGVFGPAVAIYPDDAPVWMRAQDHHSNRPERRRGRVATGHTCNALLRWGGTPWRDERFDIGRGRSGGEDTEFFFRLHRLGATYEIAEDAVVHERVEPDRLNLEWLRRRKLRAGQSYAASAARPAERFGLFSSAGAKAGYCRLRAAAGDEGARGFWSLRAAFHQGVCLGCLGVRQAEIYGC